MAMRLILITIFPFSMKFVVPNHWLLVGWLVDHHNPNVLKAFFCVIFPKNYVPKWWKGSGQKIVTNYEIDHLEC